MTSIRGKCHTEFFNLLPNLRFTVLLMLAGLVFVAIFANRAYFEKARYEFKWTKPKSALETDKESISSKPLDELLMRLPEISSQHGDYIENYTPRLKNLYYNDTTDNGYQITTYYVAAELARRFRAKYIIDLGCGNAFKTAKLSKEFQVIAVDYKANLEAAKKKFSKLENITFIESDLDNVVCKLPEYIEDKLADSVVMSADVIEHIVDPYRCYFPILLRVAELARAIILSTPERRQFMMNIYRGAKQYMKGPPGNTCHVREWTIDELNHMLQDVGLQHVFSAFMCMHIESCANFDGFNNQIHVMDNARLRRHHWSNVQSVTVHVILVVHNQTVKFVSDSVKTAKEEGLHVVLVAFPDVILPTIDDEIVRIQKLQDIATLVNHSSFGANDWIVLLEVNERLRTTIPSGRYQNLRKTISNIASDPAGWNSIGITDCFLRSSKGEKFETCQPEVSGGAWDYGRDFRPTVDTAKHKLRIWKNDVGPIEIKIVRTDAGNEVIGSIQISGNRKLYPYYLVALKYHPDHRYDLLPENNQLRMQMVDISIGFVQKSMLATCASNILY